MLLVGLQERFYKEVTLKLGTCFNFQRKFHGKKHPKRTDSETATALSPLCSALLHERVFQAAGPLPLPLSVSLPLSRPPSTSPINPISRLRLTAHTSRSGGLSASRGTMPLADRTGLPRCGEARLCSHDPQNAFTATSLARQSRALHTRKCARNEGAPSSSGMMWTKAD